MHKKTEYSLLILLFFVLATFFIFKAGFRVGAADEPMIQYLSGYAWSSNIGWINFNNSKTPTQPQYVVSYNNDTASSNYRKFSGYAWSSNIGWISFGCGTDVDGTTNRKVCSEDLGGAAPNYPSVGGVSRLGPTLDSNNLIGFARACSVFVSGCSGDLKGQLDRGGWDGWIALSGQTTNSAEYGVKYDSDTKRLYGYAWGGGNDDIGGQNKSPQFPGWINFDISGTLNDVYGEPSGGGEPGGGSGDPATFITDSTRLCDQPDCGEPVAVTFTCSHNPVAITLGQPVTWTITSNDSNSYSYQWTVTPADPALIRGTPLDNKDYYYTGELTDTMTAYYYKQGTPNKWETKVHIRGTGTDTTDIQGICPVQNDGILKKVEDVVGDINYSYEVFDKDFILDAEPALTAQFIRSIRAITVPDATVSINPVPNYKTPVTVKFVAIELKQGNNPPEVISGVGGRLVVEPQFWVGTDPSASEITLGDGNGAYAVAKLRLKLTKNQSSSNQSLPSSSDTNVYTVVLDSSSGGHRYELPLTINNPSGGVIER